MSAQRLGARKVRRLRALTGMCVKFAVAYGGYTYEFVTFSDEHGWFDLKTGAWGMYPEPDHFSSCR